jgi:hypothetical protein
MSINVCRVKKNLIAIDNSRQKNVVQKLLVVDPTVPVRMNSVIMNLFESLLLHYHLFVLRVSFSVAYW